jgi:hypothetical protein
MKDDRKWDVALSLLIGLMGCAGILVVIAPRIGYVFRQLRVPLPDWTTMTLSLSDLALAYPILAAIVITAAPASVHAWDGRAVAIGRVAIPLLSLLAWGWLIFALLLPFMSILWGIGTKKGY